MMRGLRKAHLEAVVMAFKSGGPIHVVIMAGRPCAAHDTLGVDSVVHTVTCSDPLFVRLAEDELRAIAEMEGAAS